MLLASLSAFGQAFVPADILQTDIDTLSVGDITGELEVMAFFRDNEYDGSTVKGYSLPGTWIRPKVKFTPVENVRLEVGAHALIFDGANKYPNYAYHDIGKWKGNQYQDGAHILPWVRAQMNIGSTRFVLGDIYGDANHRFSVPMYNSEQLYSADPEAGFQILHYGRRFSADLFLNWQSYQFEEDTHQEAFSVGLSSRVNLVGCGDEPVNDKCRQGWEVNIPVQMLLQHRGGEQDISGLGLGVQTIANGLLGLQAEKNYLRSSRQPLNKLAFEADILGCYQQKGQLWPFDSGLAFHANAAATLWNELNLRLGYFLAPGNYVSLYGSPFFSTIGLKTPGEYYDRRNTAYLHLGYQRSFGHSNVYTFGADLEFYHSSMGNSLTEDTFAFGVYMRLRPTEVFFKRNKNTVKY